jgi:hypothetical protein
MRSGREKRIRGEDLLQCPIAHHKSMITGAEIEPDPPCRGSGKSHIKIIYVNQIFELPNPFIVRASVLNTNSKSRSTKLRPNKSELCDISPITKHYFIPLCIQNYLFINISNANFLLARIMYAIISLYAQTTNIFFMTIKI